MTVFRSSFHWAVNKKNRFRFGKADPEGKKSDLLDPRVRPKKVKKFRPRTPGHK